MMWADEHDDVLRSMIDTMSFTLIAATINQRFGTSFSRNAVIGRAHRMGLDKPRPVSTVRDRRADGFNQVARKINRRKTASGPLLQKIVARGERDAPKIKVEPFEPRAADIVSLRKTIVEVVMFAECHWADDEPNAAGQMTFCGHSTRIGSNWCEAHQKIVWQARQARAKQNPIYRETKRRAA